jgi:hypothetical protein
MALCGLILGYFFLTAKYGRLIGPGGVFQMDFGGGAAAPIVYLCAPGYP